MFAGQQLWIYLAILAWSLPWKGVALWKASQKKDMWWFVALLLVNTVGILDALYIFYISERKSLKK